MITSKLFELKNQETKKKKKKFNNIFNKFINLFII